MTPERLVAIGAAARVALEWRPDAGPTLAELVAREVEAAIRDERAACAKLCTEVAEDWWRETRKLPLLASRCADRIRERAR